MAHFAFSACNKLTTNAKKSSFFQWFSYTFSKTAVLTKIMFQFYKTPAANNPSQNNQNMDFLKRTKHEQPTRPVVRNRRTRDIILR